MKDRVDRRARVKSLFDHTGLDVEFSMGVEVNPQMKGYKELNAGKPHIRDNQKGCWLSHVKVWRDIIRNGHEISTIFEDDVDFSMNIHYKIHYALDLMNGTATKNNISQEFVPKDLKPGYKDPGWDLMFFGHCSIFEDRGIFVVNDIDFVPATKPYCNHGYLISLVGARRLIDLMGEMIVGPLDLAIIREVEKTDPKEKLRAFSFRVPIAKQRRDLYKNDEGVRAPIFEAPEGSLLDHVTKYSRLYTHKEIVNMGL
ncbi:hypothetical protein H4219_001892 [Mycoemilia scoparia]|uniref:Glycosyl transferase family 25 domain-containing protein n=1 Tax=Mycoemilia scoparia TaxID=417184 RepID=A0A9W7ZZR3_9FUNG|nr:hypothetical protein H4219_001892 [Mycoemilia scoparia]